MYICLVIIILFIKKYKIIINIIYFFIKDKLIQKNISFKINVLINK